MRHSIDSDDLVTFQKFYSQYPEKENIIYMYFTTNLLHYVTKSAGLVPKDINLVLIMAGVTDEEEEYVKKVIQRPYVRLKNGCMDGYIWEMLFNTNQYNFGWLDIDAFVFNKDIFYEMLDVKENVSVNSIWNRKYLKTGINEYLANTYFQFHNIQCIHDIIGKYDSISPMMSIYEEEKKYTNYGYYVPQNLRKIILEHYPEIADRTCQFYDTTFLYQIIAYINHYTIGNIRSFHQDGDYYSNEAIHLGASCVIHKIKLGSDLNRIYCRFNMRYSYLILKRYSNQLPVQYKEFIKHYEENMLNNGVNIELNDVEKHVKSYLKRYGLSDEVYLA